MPEPGYVYLGQPGAKRVSTRKLRRKARQYGLPPVGTQQITKGESDQIMNVQQRDPGDGMVGYTLFQFTPKAWGEDSAAMKKWNELGGAQGVVNDLDKQFEMARFLYKSAGNSFDPWYGTKYLTDRSGEGTLGPMKKQAKGGGSLGTPGKLKAGTPTTVTPGMTTTDSKSAMLAALMDSNKSVSLLDRYRTQVSSGRYTVQTPTTVTPGRPASYTPGRGPQAGAAAQPNGRLAKVKAEMDAIDAKNNAGKLPYLWGGGHDRKHPRGSKITPLDCSGAVSRVLGINPMVSGQFAKWGKPGKGKNITIWANDTHVLMEVGGKFWGTSGSNPGGGAGWIDNPGKAYLSRFTPRHPG
jgi:hypothetical protein